MTTENKLDTKNIANIDGAGIFISRIKDMTKSIEKCMDTIEQINKGTYGGGAVTPIEFTLKSHPDDLTEPLKELSNAITELCKVAYTGQKPEAEPKNDTTEHTDATPEQTKDMVAPESDMTIDDDGAPFSNKDEETDAETGIAEETDITEEDMADENTDEQAYAPIEKKVKKPLDKFALKAVVNSVETLCDYCDVEEEPEDKECDDCKVTLLKMMLEDRLVTA